MDAETKDRLFKQGENKDELLEYLKSPNKL